MKPILLGIDGIGYGSFTECELNNLTYLVNSVNRGVIENPDLKDPYRAWWSVLMMEPVSSAPTIRPEESMLVRLVKAALVNIPVSNPTYGIYSIPMDSSTPAEEEVSRVIEAALREAEDKPVVAAVTAVDRFKDRADLCNVYRVVDEGVGELLKEADDFIIFSPYGEPEGGEYYSYGIYLSTVPRPRPHDTVKVFEVPALFAELASRV